MWFARLFLLVLVQSGTVCQIHKSAILAEEQRYQIKYQVNVNSGLQKENFKIHEVVLCIFFFWKWLSSEMVVFFLAYATNRTIAAQRSLLPCSPNFPTQMGYTSPTKKARIVLLKRQGVPVRDIAERYAIDTSTVYRIAQKYGESKDFYHVKPKPSLPRKFTRNDVHTAVRMLVKTHVHDVADLQRKFFPSLHPDTIQRLATCGAEGLCTPQEAYLVPCSQGKAPRMGRSPCTLVS